VATSERQWSPALGVPFECSGKNTTTDVPQEIIDSDHGEVDIGDHFSLWKILNPKRKERFHQLLERK